MIKILVSLQKVAQTFQILTFFPMEYIDYFSATELSLSGMVSNLPKNKFEKIWVPLPVPSTKSTIQIAEVETLQTKFLSVQLHKNSRVRR